MHIPLLATAQRGPFISAHRGYSSDYPENTLPALQAALDAGANVAEIDVRLTKDKKLVLMHDAKVDRTTDGSGPITDFTLEEVQKLDAGRWFDRKFAGVRVPTLDEVLAWSKGRLGILIELKNYPERDPVFVDELIATVRRHDAAGFAFPAGFDHATLAEIHRRQPDWRLEMILHCRLADHLHAARACGAALVSHEPEYCVRSDVEELHAAGVAVLATLLSVEHGHELLDCGVDFFESDDVRLARDALHHLGKV